MKEITQEEYLSALGIIQKYKEQQRDKKLAPNGLPDLALEDSGLSTRAYRGLKRAHYNRMVDFRGHTVEDLLKYRNIGPSAIKDIIEKFKAIGVNIE